ncbi:hypothetical protein YH65_11060 [Sulfurovum lithotrophicum]|uniref:Methyltransferase n=1 Tax=Sulfurovum lithotrophicum TaxID=206403 RepID=A0A7U4RRI3_9BACT|nr:hypothetical protein [Sulfurovum lithotrophicum]AKF25860.1 hypothetical protein YH65_11060 [Sulfurovum lithotrophicum]
MKKFIASLAGLVGMSVASMAAATPLDLTTLSTQIDDAGTQVNSFAPTVIGFVLVMVIIGAVIKLTRKA